MQRLMLIILTLGLLSLTACSDQIHDACELEDAGFQGTFSEVQKEVFNKYCIGCHGGAAPEAGLVLTSGASYTNIVGRLTSTGTDTLVAPGAPGRSLLLQRLNSSGDDVMPPAGNLQQNLLDLMNTWVAEGAQNN